PAPNTSDNAYFGDVVAGALTRRALLRAGAVIGVAAGAAGAAGSFSQAAAASAGAAARRGGGRGPRGLGFEPVAPNTADAVTVPPGYQQQVVIRWGDPVLRGAPEFLPGRQTAEAQARQF